MGKNLRSECPKCGSLQPSEHKFCFKCGSSLSPGPIAKIIASAKGRFTQAAGERQTKETENRISELALVYHLLFTGSGAKGELEELLSREEELLQVLTDEEVARARAEAELVTSMYDSMMFL